jgi:hypothetical protein
VNDDGVTGDSDSPMLLQSPWWRRVKVAGGWSAVSDDPLVLQRRIGPFVLAYGPHAFGCDDHGGSDEQSGSDGCAGRNGTPPAEAVEILGAAGRRSGATLVRWDVPWERECFPEEEARSLGLLPSPMRVQPPDTVIVPLSPHEDRLLGQMKQKTRYNIRLALRKEVQVTAIPGELVSPPSGPPPSGGLEQWYRLYRETAVRDGIAIHPFSYYAGVIAAAVEMAAAGMAAPSITLYMARHEGDLLGGIITASWRGTTTYLYGASGNVKRNLMGAYALQWEAMKAAAVAGDRSYDLFGIPPTDDPGHPMHGLYRFKTGFGGRIVHRAGAWDIPLHRVGAAAYRLAEKGRKWYYFSFRKRTRPGGSS